MKQVTLNANNISKAPNYDGYSRDAPIRNIIYELYNELKAEYETMEIEFFDPFGEDVDIFLQQHMERWAKTDSVTEYIVYSYKQYSEGHRAYWKEFTHSFLMLDGHFEHGIDPSCSIQQFIDYAADQQSMKSLGPLPCIESFDSSQLHIVNGLSSAYALIEKAKNLAPVELSEFFMDGVRSLPCRKIDFDNLTHIGFNLYCITSDIYRAQSEALSTAKNLRERVEDQDSDLWRLQFANAPIYPLPNNDGEWTVKIIAGYYRIHERAVTRAVQEKFRDLSHGYGIRITLNEQQMKAVVTRLLNKPIISKKIAERRRRNT